MSSQEWVPQTTDKLRAAVASFDREMGSLDRQGAAVGTTPETPSVVRMWRDLVGLLGLPPPHETRSCPVCGHTGMRDATRCGYCWVKLAPLQQPT